MKNKNNKSTNGTKKKGKKRPSTTTDEESSKVDWLSSLVKDASPSTNLPTKVERIQRREEKKRRKLEKQELNNKNNKNNKQQQIKQLDVGAAQQHQSRKNLKLLSNRIQQIYLEKKKNNNKKQLELYSCTDKKGKATSFKRWKDDDAIQPRKCDYGGLGYAKVSLFLPLSDPSFIPKLKEEFNEHVNGFFGKQRTKAMKKQLDGNMLWRRLLAEKKNGKKKKNNKSEERVEAMIAAGKL
mmetsp:Transcript_16357/g.18860  ORF Transcript_16357/g.18860 Transcript_16357/m.18860 type:complete len:239 (+) Transcript_16357:131-847(+)